MAEILTEEEKKRIEYAVKSHVTDLSGKMMADIINASSAEFTAKYDPYTKSLSVGSKMPVNMIEVKLNIESGKAVINGR